MLLQWKDINLQKGLLTVSSSCHDTSGGIVFDEPKTATSRRVIPLPKQLLPKLKSIKKSSNSDFVVSVGGNAVSVRSYQRSFELLLKKQNIVHRGFHSCIPDDVSAFPDPLSGLFFLHFFLYKVVLECFSRRFFLSAAHTYGSPSSCTI